MNADKSLILFGPGKYFGYEIAKRFSEEGFHIVLIARDLHKLEELKARLSKENVGVTLISANVENSTNLREILRKNFENLPDAKAVIYNVKLSVPGNGLTLSPEQLAEALSINVSGALSAIQASASLLVSGGSILLTGGGYKDKPDPEKVSLSVSKGALHTLYLSMKNLLKSQDIYLGTLIIDGSVREEGAIKPADVAEAFLKLHQENPESPRVIS